MYQDCGGIQLQSFDLEVCLSGGMVSTQGGVCLEIRGVCIGGCLPWGGVSVKGTGQEGMTHACENITLP